MIRSVIRMMRATALVSALLGTGAAADPWMVRGPAAGRGPGRETGGFRPNGGEAPAAPLGPGEASVSGTGAARRSIPDRSGRAGSPGPRRHPRGRGARRAHPDSPRSAADDPGALPVGYSARRHRVHEAAGSLETAGPRLFLSALDPDVSGELFVTLSTGGTVALVIVPAGPGERDVVVRVVSPVTEATARMAETAGLTPLRLLRAMILDVPLPGLSLAPGDGRVVYEDGALRLTLLRTWTSPSLEGVVLAAENLRPLWIRLPLDRLAFAGLLAVHAEAEQLAPPPATPEQALAARHRTRLYLVQVAEGR